MAFLPWLAMSAALPIKGIDGPALPVRFVRSMEKLSISVGPEWVKGVHPVEFNYVLPKRVEDLAAELRTEFPQAPVPHLPPPVARPDRTGHFPVGIAPVYAWSRTANSVVQTITIWQPGNRTSPTQDKKWGTHLTPLAEVTIAEHPVELGPRPAVWYARAIASSPPVPAPAIPWMNGVTADHISVTSFDWLEGINDATSVGHDATKGSLIVTTPVGDVTRAALPWLSAHGFSESGLGSYFRPQAGLFEIRISNRLVAGRNATSITLYSSNRKATHAVEDERG